MSDEAWQILKWVVIIIAIAWLYGLIMDVRRRRARDYWNEKRLRWFLLQYLIPHARHWDILICAGFVWGGVVLATSVLATTWFSEQGVYISPPSWLSTPPGALAAFIGLSLGVAGVLNTLVILGREPQIIRQFEHLFYAVNDWANKNQKEDPAKSTMFTQHVFVIDYTPRIGDISTIRSGAISDAEWEKTIPARFYHLFDRLTVDYFKHCNAHFIFLASSGFSLFSPSPLEMFYERSYSRQREYSGDKAELSQRVKKRVQEVEEAIDRLDKGSAAVWRAMDIRAEHYFVTKDVAITYSIVPERREKEEKNEINGAVTHDIDQINALTEVARDYLREAITPKIEGDQMVFAVGQAHIDKMEIEYYNGNKNRVREQYVTLAGRLDAGHREGLNMKPNESRWFRVRLRKDGRGRNAPGEIWSEFSYFVPIPQVNVSSGGG